VELRRELTLKPFTLQFYVDRAKVKSVKFSKAGLLFQVDMLGRASFKLSFSK
jgi:hypothetical protein